ncbi:DNA-binding response regulator [Pedobacter yulinensis]|uniref:DNA-binding response regulator n=1 Tax=Pedobacter yulinensis TaxID=2126353 RepID=A0A2T3HMH9_9SPHI|nr:response regulator transcription factor [Pedobacter yulinensis]PST83639.1 DNA-binding response regulator [Pedobacter yulinensis]
MKVRCLIVDDEVPARELIRMHLSGLKGFEVAGSLGNAVEVPAFLREHKVDLIFLDIRMPGFSGLDLLRSLNGTQQVILTTAYREYAADAFELEAFDYLMKPVTRERFMQAISKYLRHDRINARQERAALAGPAYVFFKVGREHVKVLLSDIVFIEGLSDYIKVHTVTRSYVASEKLGAMEEKLCAGGFVRIHKSFIIALDKMTGYTADQVLIQERSLPLGRLYKAGFIKRVEAPGR